MDMKMAADLMWLFFVSVAGFGGGFLFFRLIKWTFSIE